MDSPAQIIHIAQTEPLPPGWTVFPLHTAFLRAQSWRWLIYSGVGVAMLVVLLYITAFATTIVAIVLYAIVGVIILGSLAQCLTYTRLARDPKNSLIVLTPECLAFQTGHRITAIPFSACGEIFTQHFEGELWRTKTDASGNHAETFGRQDMVQSIYTPIAKRIPKDRTIRGPDMLAVVDTRTDQVVIIMRDDRFGPILAIAEQIRSYQRAAAQAGA